MDRTSIPDIADLRSRRAERTAEAMNHLGAFLDAMARSLLLLDAWMFSAFALGFILLEEHWRDEPLDKHPEFKTRGVAAGIVWPPSPEVEVVCIHRER